MYYSIPSIPEEKDPFDRSWYFMLLWSLVHIGCLNIEMNCARSPVIPDSCVRKSEPCPCRPELNYLYSSWTFNVDKWPKLVQCRPGKLVPLVLSLLAKVTLVQRHSSPFHLVIKKHDDHKIVTFTLGYTDLDGIPLSLGLSIQTDTFSFSQPCETT